MTDIAKPSVCCVQVGARLHYGTPAALAGAGMLRKLVTDSNARMLGNGIPSGFVSLSPKPLRRAFGRKVPEIVSSDQLVSLMRPSVDVLIGSRLAPAKAKDAAWWYERGWGGHRLARRAIADDFYGADTLYVHPCDATNAIHAAHDRGMRVVYESIAHPDDTLIENAEAEKFGRPPVMDPDLALRNIEFFLREIAYATTVIAASPYTKSGLVAYGVPSEKIQLVRYGIDLQSFLRVDVTPQRGKVLFVGTVGYRKGSLYFAEMARKMAGRADLSFEVVGPIATAVNGLPGLEGPIYHGQVPRQEVAHHFATADVFAFPTLSDGFGLTLLEAMAAGVPVVCTTNCADLVKDGVNGFVVPPRDVDAMGQRIAQIVEDRPLRDRMSAAARATAARHTLEDYAEALANAVAASPGAAAATSPFIIPISRTESVRS